ncbi:MAG TPA: phage tail tube protein [Candidatus Paenibacillus intestinavium]|nr:phage tail tube protein [Candidatus Paenibacillus intestinavium]
MKPDVRQTFTGTEGKVWIGADEISEIDQFSSEVTMNYEEMNFVGHYGTFQREIGWAGEGSLTMKKINSRALKLFAAAFKRGEAPRLVIVGLVKNGLGQSQRVTMKDCTFDKFSLAQFENKAITNEELSFKFSDYDVVDLVD